MRIDRGRRERQLGHEYECGPVCTQCKTESEISMLRKTNIGTCHNLQKDSLEAHVTWGAVRGPSRKPDEVGVAITRQKKNGI